MPFYEYMCDGCGKDREKVKEAHVQVLIARDRGPLGLRDRLARRGLRLLDGPQFADKKISKPGGRKVAGLYFFFLLWYSRLKQKTEICF
jgi:hypothetical protein